MERNGGRRSRTIASVVSVVLVIASIAVFAGPSFGQTSKPMIALLNPSGFASAGERGIIVSDAQPDEGPGCCDSMTPGYRLSAWASNATPEMRVFFSIVQRAIDVEIAATTSPGTNMWQAEWEIPPEILDGPATIAAYLVDGEDPVAVTEQDVTIMRVQENVRITNPGSGGAFGTYAALGVELPETGSGARKAPIGVVDAPYTATPEMAYVRTFYTTSAPGSEPEWKMCGTELVGATRAGNGVRCTLADAADQLNVTAVAAVANDSPDDYEARFNQSSDAIAVGQPYAQELTSFQFTSPGTQRVEKELTSGMFFCSAAESVQLTDQLGRQIAGANVDVHATGPNDQLKFDTFSILTINKAPDRGAHTTEPGFDCTGQRTALPTSPPSNANPDDQAEHPRFGLPDRKHIETLGGGTNDLGSFSFKLHATAQGVSDFTVWVDEADDGCLTNDDMFTQSEMSVTGSIGWAQDPGFPLMQALETPVPCAGPTPDPDPTDLPGGEEDGSRAVSIRIAKTPVTLGRPTDFVGRIQAADNACAAGERVVLKARKPGGRFWAVARGRTNSQGRYTLTKTARAPRDYRVVAPSADFCNRATSAIMQLRR
jgi:hypothetical protein